MQSIIETFIDIPGPWFLLLFGVYALVIIYAFSSVIKKNDPTSKLEVPEPTSLDAIDIAILRRGVRGAISYTVFNLWKKGIVKIDKENRSLETIKTNVKGLNKLEDTICRFTTQPKRFKQIFTTAVMRSLLFVIEDNKKRLARLKLIADYEIKSWKFRSTILCLAFIFIPGGFKLYLGVTHDKPVAFLFFLILGLGIFSFVTIKPNASRITALGRKFLRQCRDRFEHVKNIDFEEEDEGVFEDDDFLYAVAAYGASGIVSQNFSGIIEDPASFDRRISPRTTGFGCSSCGGGCSSDGCSGGCSSSGCSGGGGCSSGCGGGGCGGCGGD